MHRIFKKTQRGVAELEQHELQLRPELRRLLILIDGARSVESLAKLFRAQEIEGLIDELVAVEAIEVVGTAVSYVPMSNGADKANGLGAIEFDAARRAAEVAVKALLGRQADTFIDAIRQSRDWQAFRVAVSAVQLRLIGVHGEEAATRYVVAIRDAVQDARRTSADG